MGEADPKAPQDHVLAPLSNGDVLLLGVYTPLSLQMAHLAPLAAEDFGAFSVELKSDD